MVRQIAATIIWVIIGALYVCLAEGASIVSGLYFAVTSMSTAGLYAVTSTSDGSVYWFTGVFCLIGVPLYAIMLGSYANILVEQYNKEQLLDSIHQRMGGAEVAFLEHLVQNEHKDRADFADYVEIQLLRLGKVDREFLRQLREDFNALDQDGEGRVPLNAFLSIAQQKAVHQHQQHQEISKKTHRDDEERDEMQGDALFEQVEASIEAEV